MTIPAFLGHSGLAIPNGFLPNLLAHLSGARTLSRLVGEACESCEGSAFSRRLLTALDISSSPNPARPPFPSTGPVVVTCNRPLGGIVEALLVTELVQRVRQDVKVLFGPTLRHVEQLSSEWLFLSRHDDTALEARVNNQAAERLASDCLDRRGVLVVFPGALTEDGWNDGGQDRSWNPAIWTFAQEHDAVLLPIAICAEGQWVGARLARLCRLFSDMAIIRETVDSRQRCFGLAVGSVMHPGAARGRVEALIGMERARLATLELANGGFA